MIEQNFSYLIVKSHDHCRKTLSDNTNALKLMSTERKFKVAATDLTYPPDIPREMLRDIATLYQVDHKAGKELAEALRDADAVIQNLATQITADVIKEMQKCKTIVRDAIGFDNVDLGAAGKKGIVVCNVPDYCVEEVADQTLALILGLIKKICFLNNYVKSGKWGWQVAIPIPRLRGRTLGIIGLGRIGTAVALRAKAFGLQVIVYDPYLTSGRDVSLGVRSVSFDSLLSESDIITCHVPLTPETRHMLGAKEFAKMKDGVFVINTSRGPIIELNAIIDALKSRKVAGAALDVQEKEPPDQNNPLFKMDQVILTPHSSHLSAEALIERQKKAAEEVMRVLRNEPPKNPVNLDQLEK